MTSPDARVDQKKRAQKKTCTCLGSCKGAEGLGDGWECALAQQNKPDLRDRLEQVITAHLITADKGMYTSLPSVITKHIDALLQESQEEIARYRGLYEVADRMRRDEAEGRQFAEKQLQESQESYDRLNMEMAERDQQHAEDLAGLHLCPLHQPSVWESDGTCPLCEGNDSRNQLEASQEAITRWQDVAKAHGDEAHELAAQLVAAESQLTASQEAITRLRETVQMLAAGKSPCGHWAAYAHTEDGGKAITCWQCRAEHAESELAALRAGRETPAPQHVHCSTCGKRCSGVDPELGLVVRAWVECPECIQSKPETPAPAWLPMESAPQDGTPFLAYYAEGGLVVRRLNKSGHCVDVLGQRAGRPTHWMPLPPGPQLRGKIAEREQC